MKKALDMYVNYILIGVLSLVVLFFLPFIGSEAGLKLDLPNTPAGWIVFSFTKIITAVINVLIFHCFVKQAKINVRDNEKFIEAEKILEESKNLEEVYISPEKFLNQQYRSKGTTIAITTILSAFAISTSILTFNLIMFLTYLFTIVMGIVFGILEMYKVEGYYTYDYWTYAKYIEKELKEKNICSENEHLEKEITNDNFA